MLSKDGEAAEEFSLEKGRKKTKSQIDQGFYILSRFLEGVRATTFAPNAMKCFLRTQTFTD